MCVCFGFSVCFVLRSYNGATNFWGGAGIVGAQVPVGTGVAWANKLQHKGDGYVGESSPQ